MRSKKGKRGYPSSRKKSKGSIPTLPKNLSTTEIYVKKKKERGPGSKGEKE